MFTLNNIALSRGSETLLQNANLAVYERDVIGIVGANGCGKTTLFAALKGELEPSAGEINAKKQLQLQAIEQEIVDLHLSATDYVISGHKALFRALKTLEEAEASEDFETAFDCHAKIHELNGYDAKARAAKILTGLGFVHQKQSDLVQSFSGGWRMRLSLAKCLFAPSECLLLDEPTNHLDLEAIIWLEQFIKSYSGAVLIISHDRDFLDNCVTQIAHIEQRQLNLYKGNYQSFEHNRALKIAAHNAQFAKQQQKIEHMMGFVSKFKAKATKAKQAQSRLKAIEKMEKLSPLYSRSAFSFEFLAPNSIPNPMVTSSRLALGYNDQAVLKRITLSVLAGQRIGLLGINGAGKSTLIKGLCGELTPLNGKLTIASNLSIGYFAQHQVDSLPLDTPALVYCRRLYPNMSEREAINYLAKFNFSRDQSLRIIESFSGGEKARLSLAMIIAGRPNLLLLDEPTNHLDIEMREALELALMNYQGSLILVSHDRHLLRSLVDELWLVDSGCVEPFDGTVEDYQSLYS